MSWTPTDEQWAPVVGYEGLYEASTHGRIRSTPRRVGSRYGQTRIAPGVILKPHVNDRGRHRVSLSREGAKNTLLVHRVVADAFLGPQPKGAEVCHRDDNPSNNHIANLYWGTHTQNMDDASRNRRLANVRKTHCPAGHPLEGDNLRVSRGRRGCVTCIRRIGRETYQRKRKESAA